MPGGYVVSEDIHYSSRAPLILLSSQNTSFFGRKQYFYSKQYYHMLSELVKVSLDSFSIFDSRLDDSFSVSYFFLHSYHKRSWSDGMGNDSGILPYPHENIAAKVIHCNFSTVKISYVQTGLHKKKFRSFYISSKIIFAYIWI